MHKTHLNQFKKGQIIGLWKEKLSKREISIVLKVHRTTVHRIIGRYQEYGDVVVERKKGNGRRKKTTEMEAKEIIRIALAKRTVTSKEIKEEMVLSVCSRTICNRLNERGISNHFAPKKPF